MGTFCILVGILMIFGVKDIIMMRNQQRALGDAVSLSSTPNFRRGNRNIDRGTWQ
jgi:hypothetical protein